MIYYLEGGVYLENLSADELDAPSQAITFLVQEIRDKLLCLSLRVLISHIQGD